MRKVIPDQKAMDVVAVSETHNDRYYGSIRESDGQKAFMSAVTYLGSPKMFTVKELNVGHGYTYGGSRLDIIKSLMGSGHTVYEFDTAKELFKWLAE